ncbi:hypothetical protein CVT24_010840 [Panaeolus cyanescens]|uniref:G domain-containing protein n=1 Tax=Panaeolus cyanescens TaxID=181874 RepID=A0A409YYF6_9AGAR|nr:hypothetical protein CVT24_010840 [Panaeolus cyanescens]
MSTPKWKLFLKLNLATKSIKEIPASVLPNPIITGRGSADLVQPTPAQVTLLQKTSTAELHRRSNGPITSFVLTTLVTEYLSQRNHSFLKESITASSTPHTRLLVVGATCLFCKPPQVTSWMTEKGVLWSIPTITQVRYNPLKLTSQVSNSVTEAPVAFLTMGDLKIECIKDATIRQANFDPVDNNKDVITLIMGPTGAGKSRFIEALEGNDTLRISKDQLESYTQRIETYKLDNVLWWEGPGTSPTLNGGRNNQGIYILDTPGSSDSQLSELEIVKMINEWLKSHNCTSIDCILYLCPITDIRLPRSKRRTIDMLKSLTRINERNPGVVVVVTTMWDRLWNERSINAAEGRFNQLQDNVWKDLLDTGGLITKFTNTHESAVDVINTLRARVTRGRNPHTAYNMEEAGIMKDAPFGRYLYQDLLDRLQNAQQHRQSLDAELVLPETQRSHELESDVRRRLQKIHCLISKLEIQVVGFGEPPAGFEYMSPVRHALMTKHNKGVGTFARIISSLKHLLEKGAVYHFRGGIKALISTLQGSKFRSSL